MARSRGRMRCSAPTANPGVPSCFDFRPDRRYAVRSRVLQTVSLMTDTLPDRLSTNPDSPFYDEALLARGIGIRFAGQEKTNVEEYCVSEGWIRVAAGKALDRKGNPLTIKLKGPVEPYFKDETSDRKS